jgi:ankyrin repeat protein
VKLLIAAGADINKPSQNGATPLIAAIVKNQIEAMRFLISSGAKTASPPGTPSLYQIAVNEKNPPALRVLRYEAGIKPPK